MIYLAYEDLLDFLKEPLPEGSGMMQCMISRNRNYLNRLCPKYEIYYEREFKFLMASKRSLNSSKYVIGIHPNEFD